MAMIYLASSRFVNFMTIIDAFAIIDRKTDKTKRRIARTISHKAFRTMTIQNKKITKTFKSTFTSVARNEVVPVTFARTRAMIAFTGKTPSRCNQYRTMTLKSTEADRTRKRIGSRRGRRKWIHLVSYRVHRLYLKKRYKPNCITRFMYRIYFTWHSNTAGSCSTHSQRRCETRS